MNKHPGRQTCSIRRLGNAGDVLRNARLRVTAGRLRIVEVFSSADRPLSPEEVCRNIPEGLVDRATVYRTISHLLDSDILHCAYSGGRTSYYELSDHCADDACHPHFICTDCGSATCFYEEAAPLGPQLPKGFRLERSKLTLFGLCPDCSGAAG